MPNLKHLKGMRRGACSGGEKGEPILNIEGAYSEASERGEEGVPVLNLEGA